MSGASSSTPPPPLPEPPRGLQLALWVTAMAWAVAAGLLAGHAGQGIAVRFGLGAVEALLERLFELFLLVFGLRLLDRLATRGRYAADVLPLPRRSTRTAEWGLGAAIGWGLALALVLPVVLSGNLHAQLNLDGPSLLAAVIALLTVLAGALTQEVLFRGYPFKRLSAAVGTNWAAVLMSVLFALYLAIAAQNRFGTAHWWISLLSWTLLGLLLATAYLRTNALWTSWGLAFAYRAVLAVLLGLAVEGRGEFGAIAGTSVTGPGWLTGGRTGLEAAWLAPIFLIIGLSVLYTATREYAWNYTHPLILPAGYAVEVAPPAAHVAMERTAAAAPPPLVQILSATPQGATVRESAPIIERPSPSGDPS